MAALGAGQGVGQGHSVRSAPLSFVLEAHAPDVEHGVLGREAQAPGVECLGAIGQAEQVEGGVCVHRAALKGVAEGPDEGLAALGAADFKGRPAKIGSRGGSLELRACCIHVSPRGPAVGAARSSQTDSIRYWSILITTRAKGPKQPMAEGKKRNPVKRARPNMLALRTSDEEHALLQAEADRLDLPLTTWARSVLLREAKKRTGQGEE